MDRWKNSYRDSWDTSAKKEAFVKKLIEDTVGVKMVKNGFGAGSSKLIKGYAKDNGYDKGGADWYIPKLDAYVEVTGPNVTMPDDAPLWVRPDKLENTDGKLKAGIGAAHFIVHVQNGQRLVRSIVLDRRFLDRVFVAKVFPIVTPTIRGNKETYYAIPANDYAVVTTIDLIIELLRCTTVTKPKLKKQNHPVTSA